MKNGIMITIQKARADGNKNKKNKELFRELKSPCFDLPIPSPLFEGYFT
jgi:hypothetical protein